jgi:hypothetical protein
MVRKLDVVGNNPTTKTSKIDDKNVIANQDITEQNSETEDKEEEKEEKGKEEESSKTQSLSFSDKKCFRCGQKKILNNICQNCGERYDD